ncbi:MAG: hypothetical protein ACI9MC_003582 [Kiritimatiellia bacterium]|jgi:hypothetical protein
MATRPLILSLTAGAALTVACSGPKAPPTDASVSAPAVQTTADGSQPGEIVPVPDDFRTENPPPPPPPEMTGNPPPPPPPPEVIGNPPGPQVQPPTPRERLSLAHGYPKWDDVSSPHPKGATNPPSPVLIVTPLGDCYKSWEGGMIPAGPDRVEEVAKEGGGKTRIDCPPNAVAVYDAWKDEK